MPAAIVNGKRDQLQSHTQPPFKRRPFDRKHPEVTNAIACPSTVKFDERVDIMNSTERQRLVSTMADEPTRALGVVLKCGICLALLTLLVVIGGAREKEGAAPEARGSAPHSAAVAKLPSAAAHRKEVFDDRRARFAGNASERNIAGTAPVAHAETYVP
jgi:hypothetical protein